LYKNLLPGRYPITVEGEIIKFSIGKKKFGIARTSFMNNENIIVDYIFDLKKEEVLFPLQKGTGNNFYLGKYSEYRIRIDFNDLEITRIIS